MRRIRFEVWLVVLILVTQLYTVFVPANNLMNWFQSDDAFYYFKTAQNISEGHGITFDRLGRDSGFHPLWMAMLVPLFALARFDLILPLRLVAALSILLNTGAAVLIYRTARRFIVAPAAALAALLWAFAPLVMHDVLQMGLESPISAFCIALLVYRMASAPYRDDADTPRAVDTRWMLVTGGIGALTILARLDNVFLVAAAGAWLVIRPLRARYLLLADLFTIGLGVLWSYFKRVGFGIRYEDMAASQMFFLVAALALRAGLYYLAGLYERPAPGAKGAALLLAKAAAASLAASALLAGAMLVLQKLHAFNGFPRMVLLYEGGWALAALIITRLLAMLISSTSGVSAADEAPLRWQPTLLRGLCFALPIALVLAVYMGVSQLYFGTPMPVSGQIKRWWGTLPTVYGAPVNSLVQMLGVGLRSSSPWTLLKELTAWPASLLTEARFAIYGAMTLLVIAVQPRRILQAVHHLALYPLLMGGLIQLISYTGTGYIAMRPWYWVAQIMALILLLAVLVDALLCRIQRSSAPLFGRLSAPRLANRLVFALAALTVLAGVMDLTKNVQMYVKPENVVAYRQGALGIEQTTEPGALVGSTGGGVLAYFVKDRTVVNLDGLMNTNEYYRALRGGTASEYLNRIGLDYVYASQYVVTNSDPYFQFTGHLKLINPKVVGAALFRWVK